MWAGFAFGLLLLTACGSATMPLSGPVVASSERGSAPRAWDGNALESLRIPGGDECLGWLARLGIEHRSLKATRGVTTPVEVSGPVAEVRYVSAGRSSFVADCRLVLALDWIGPHLRQFGVSEVRHSGAYVYRTTRSGRPSRHAKGLAIDVHGVRVDGKFHTVKRDFEKGLGWGCDTGAPRLNQISCRLRGLRLFRELITPDHNADHHDHLHLAIADSR